ncbi:MAG: hypothetical protein ACJ703_11565 [Nitrososphaera sp.]
MQRIRLLNPEIPDEVTWGNSIYNNIISNSKYGVGAMSSHYNILDNNTFSGIESSEHRLSGDSLIIKIR